MSSFKPKKSKGDSSKNKKRKKEDENLQKNLTVLENDEEGDGVGAIEPGAASRNAEKNDENVLEDEYGAKDYR